MKFILKNYGCQMNVNTATKITQQLLTAGHTLASRDEEADVIIFNIKEEVQKKHVNTKVCKISKNMLTIHKSLVIIHL